MTGQQNARRAPSACESGRSRKCRKLILGRWRSESEFSENVTKCYGRSRKVQQFRVFSCRGSYGDLEFFGHQLHKTSPWTRSFGTALRAISPKAQAEARAHSERMTKPGHPGFVGRVNHVLLDDALERERRDIYRLALAPENQFRHRCAHCRLTLESCLAEPLSLLADW
jgi:hypothetical protein